jgi:hypothetical protein
MYSKVKIESCTFRYNTVQSAIIYATTQPSAILLSDMTRSGSAQNAGSLPYDAYDMNNVLTIHKCIFHTNKSYADAIAVYINQETSVPIKISECEIYENLASNIISGMILIKSVDKSDS